MAAVSVRSTKVLGVKPKPCFTLHTTSINIFTVQEKCTAVLSFSKRKDAVHFGRILEAKFAADKEWPVVEFSHSNNWFVRYGDVETELTKIFITEWDTDNLHSVCINHNLPIVEVEKILLAPDKLNMRGNYISWDINPEFFKDYYENLFVEG